MFYDAMFNENTEGFDFNTVTETNPKTMKPGQDPDGNPATVVFDEAEKIYLQRVAWKAIIDFDEILKKSSSLQANLLR